MTKDPTKRRRLFRRVLLLLVLLPVAAVTILVLALRLELVRHALLARLSSAVRERTGWELEIDDATLRPLLGDVLLTNTSLSPPGADGPLLTAQRVALRPVLTSLFADRLRLRTLDVNAVVLDLDRLPASPAPEGDTAPATLELPIHIDRVVVRNGTIQAAPGEAAAGWADTIHVDEIHLSGSLHAQGMSLDFGGRLGAEGPRLGSRQASVTGRLGGTLANLHLSELTVAGPGLDLQADARMGLASEAPLSGSFELAADLARLLEREGGHITARGNVDLRRHTGRLDAEIDDLAGSLVAPWMPAEVIDRYRLEDTRADAEVTVRALPGEPLTGSLEMHWRRHALSLLEAQAEIRDARVDWSVEPRLDTLDGTLVLHAQALPAEILGPWLGTTAARAALAGGSLDLDLETELESGRQDPLTATASLAWRGTGDRRLDLRLTNLAAGAAADGGLDLASLTGHLESRVQALPAELLSPWIGADLFDRLAASETSFDLNGELAFRRRTRDPLAAELTATWREAAGTIALATVRSVASRRDERGRLDLDSVRLGIALQVPDLGGHRLGAALGPDLAEVLAIERTRVEADASLVVDRHGFATDDGRARARWLDRDEIELLTLDAATSGDATLALALKAELLPASPGSRSFAGTVRVPEWAALADAVVDDGRLEIRLPDLAEAVTELRRRWPRLETFVAPSQGPGEPSLLEAALRGDLETVASINGPLLDPMVVLDARWHPHRGASVRLTGEGRPLAPLVTAKLAVDGLSLQALTSELGGLVAGTVQAKIDASGWTGSAEMAADGLELAASGLCLNHLALAATSDGRSLRLDSLVAQHRGTRVEASGALALALPPDWAELTVNARDPDGGLEYVALDLSIADGIARLESRDLRSRLGAGRVAVTAPLAALARIEGMPPLLTDAWRSTDSGRTVTVDVLLPVVDSRDLAPFLTGSLPWRVQGEDIRLDLELEPDALSAARGTLEIGDLRLETAEHAVGTIGPLRLRLARHRLDLTPIRAVLDGRPFDIRGHAELEPDRLAVADLRLTATGNVDLALLDPLLLGGVGTGPLAVEARLGGSLDTLDGRLLLDGTGGRVDYLTPYVSRFADPRVEVTLLEGTVQITAATARLNEGALDVTGSWTSDGLFLATSFDDVRYRLDYGLSALLDGNLELRLPLVEDRRGSIQGEIVVERGLVRRDVNLERELLRQLLAPAELAGGDVTGEDIDLDIRLVSKQGIRVRNNVADLRATWTPIQVRGTLAQPALDGTVDIDPGGLVFAYGQTLRIDRGSLSLRPEPGAEPVLDLATTASYEDPSITRRDTSRNLDPFATPASADTLDQGTDRTSAAAEGLTEYVADRLSAGAQELLSTPLAGAGISVRPVVVYNEGDPSAHLTVGRDLTENLTLAISVNMQQAQERTYLLQVDDLPGLARLQGQVFTNEQNNTGATLQQTLNFGGGDSEMQVGKIRIELPPGSAVDVGALRRALSIKSRDPLPEGIEFDSEIEISEALRRRGYYSANVTVTTRKTKRSNRTDMVVGVEPGPRTEVVFEGDRPPNRRRSAIATLYRSDYYERASLEEMKEQTRRALRSEGYLSPKVEVEVERAPGADGGAPQRVVVRTEGGRRVDPGPPRLPGVEPEIEERVRQRFLTHEARIELAAGDEGALAVVRSVLRNTGYPEARVLDSTLAEDGVDLAVEVELGPRRTIERIEITGVDEERARQLAPLLTVAPDEPVTSNRLVTAAVALEDELRREGFSEARVRAVTRPVEGPSERPEAGGAELRPTVVEFRVDLGPLYRLAEIELEGAQKTRKSWATRVAQLEPGETFTRTDLLDLRRRLYQTGIFTSVYVDPRLNDSGDTTLIIGVDERAPVTVGYGVRWESDEGAGIVLDVLDRNTLGRGIALGARALYTHDNQFGRIYSDLPYFLGSRYTLETYFELRDQLDEQKLPRKDRSASLQFARGFGRFSTGRVYARYLRQVTVIDDPFLGPFEDILVSPSLGVQYIFNRRTDPLSGRTGLFGSADLSGGGAFLGGDRDYLRFFGQVNLYRAAGHLFGRRLGWAQSFRLGAAEAFDDQLLPDKDVFRAGGEYSIRGYPALSLGPRDPFTGREIGGNALLVLNEELHFPITGMFSGLVFVDVGNVWEEIVDIDSELFSSVGTGLRVDSPIGLLRLDVAFPLDRREDDPAVKFYIGFGQVF